MQVTLPQTSLKSALGAVAVAVPAKSTLEILHNVLLATGDQVLEVTATTLDLLVRVTVPAVIETPGRLTLPARVLSEFVRELGAAPLQITARDAQAHLRQGVSRLRLQGRAASEFPAPPAFDFSAGWTLGPGVLPDLIAATIFAVSTEESRPILQGVRWRWADRTMSMVGTNGHRLAMRRTGLATPAATPQELLVPPKALAAVVKLLDPRAPIQVALAASFVGFQQGGTLIAARLIDGTYPDVEAILPSPAATQTTVTIDIAALAQMLRRVLVLAADFTQRIKIVVGATGIECFVRTPDLGEAQDALAATVTGDALTIGVNGAYLLEMLQHVPTPQVLLQCTGPERAMLVLPAPGSAPQVPDFVGLVMPLRLTD